MSISLSHAIWVWMLAGFMLCMALSLVFHIAVPELITGIFALLTFIFIFVNIGNAQAAP